MQIKFNHFCTDYAQFEAQLSLGLRALIISVLAAGITRPNDWMPELTETLQILVAESPSLIRLGSQMIQPSWETYFRCLGLQVATQATDMTHFEYARGFFRQASKDRLPEVILRAGERSICHQVLVSSIYTAKDTKF